MAAAGADAAPEREAILKTLVEDETAPETPTLSEDTEDLADEPTGYMPILGYQKSLPL